LFGHLKKWEIQMEENRGRGRGGIEEEAEAE